MKKLEERRQKAEAVGVYESEPKSQRELAEELEVPRTTLQYWIEKKGKIDAEPELIEFFESPVGIAFLHRLIVAIHFVITMQGSGSVRTVCSLLELSGIEQFVASSYGSQRAVTVEMEEAIVAYGQAETSRLGQEMPAKEITVCEDETFHPEVCLVAIEPVSNYIVLEAYAPDRKAETWTASMAASLNGLPVKVIQGTSDEAKALCSHIENDLGAHQSPDLFHLQYEASKATMAPLARQIREAEKVVETAQKTVQKTQASQATYLNRSPRPVGRPPDFEQRIAAAQVAESQQQAQLASALARKAQATASIQGIGECYHPYDLETGAPRDAASVAKSLATHFDTLETIATEAALSEHSVKKIRKARRVVTKMVATITFFFLTLHAKVQTLTLTSQQEDALYTLLIPAIYLQLVADKATTADHRHTLQQRSQQLLQPLLDSNSPFAALDPDEKRLLESVALESAHLFQRSSSCTEGRNGQLALRHHSLHRISPRKLSALTVVHNFFIHRSDGSTPAQRFFEAEHSSLFDYLLDHIDLPGRPAKKRPLPDPLPFLA